MTSHRTMIAQPVPELPVADVARAQRHYRDVLGFAIGWSTPDGGLGSVSRGEVAIFVRRHEGAFTPWTHWIYAEKLDETYAEMQASGARIVEPLELKPWGKRQFTVEDVDGNRFYFH